MTARAILAVLLMALIEFGQVWFYPAGFDATEAHRAFGGAFRMTLWLLATAVIALHLTRRGPEPLARAL